MALNSLGLGVSFTARDALSGVLFRLQRAFSGVEMSSAAAIAAISGGFGAMAGGIGIVSAGLAGLETSFNLASVAGRFEQDVIRAGMIAQATGKDLDMLRDAALRAAQDTPFQPTESIKALQDIAAMGFSAAESVAMLRPALDLASAGGIGVAQAADSMAAAMKVFGLDAGDASAVADKLLHIANLTGLQARDLQNALGTVGRGAGAAKQGLDEMLISMGLVKNTGVQATVAASSVSSALIFMSTRADKFKALGVSLTDANGDFRDFLDIVLDVNKAVKATGKDAPAQAAMVHGLFGKFGMTAFQATSSQLEKGREVNGIWLRGAEYLKYLREEQERATGTAEKFQTALLDTYAGVEDLMKSNFAVFVIEVGDAFKSVLLPPARLVLDALRAVTNIIHDMPVPAKQLLAVMFLAGSVFAVVAGAATFAAGGVALLAGAVMLLGTTSLVTLATFGAILGIILPLALAFTAAMVIFGGTMARIFVKDLGGATTSLQETMGQWKTMFESVLGFITEGKISGPLADEFNKLDEHQQGFVVKTVLFIEKLKAGWDAFVTRFDEIATRLGPTIDRVYDSFMKLAGALGLTDNQYMTMADGMSKDDFVAKGIKAADAVAEAFIKISDVIIEINDGLRKMAEWWDKYGWILGKVKDASDAGASAMSGSWTSGASDKLGGFVSALFDTNSWVYKAGAYDSMGTAVPNPVFATSGTARPPTGAETAMGQSMPAEAAAGQDAGMAANIADHLARQIGREAPGEFTVVTNLVMDGQTMATAVNKINRENRDTGFLADGPPTWSPGD